MILVIAAQAGANFRMERSTMPRNRISSTTGAAITAIINVPNAFPPAIFSVPAFIASTLFCSEGSCSASHDPKTGDPANAKSHDQTAEHIFEICRCARFAYIFPPKQVIEREEYEDKN